MASITRSSRRAEGLHPHHGNANPPMTRSGPGLFDHDGRTKRALDVVERDFDSMRPKKTRIAVEILSKPSSILNDSVKMPPSRPNPPTASAPKAPAKQKPQPAPLPPRAPPAQQIEDNNLTKHQAKVINGIKHELDRLQPKSVDTKEQGRKLRSQEATRFKSELSAYFPDYDEVIGNDPKEQHLLNVDTPIIVVDSNPRRGAIVPPGASPIEPLQNNLTNGSSQNCIRGYGDALFTDVYDSQRIDFGFLEAQYKNATLGDPLPDNLFEPVHKRAERLERSIRNTEKGRAQHEKDQIVRLLEGLQGHDWLRVMGVSGVTETKKKTFEPARDYFIKGCQAILDKFRNWSLEEKRRKLEKEKALAEQAEDDELEEDNDEGDEMEGEDNGGEEAVSRDDTSDGSSPAKQLREEAMARSKLAARNRKTGTAQRTAPPKPPEPPREFKSFFSKKYERDSALNRHRRAGRKVLAWGHPIPEIPEIDFELPEDYRDSELLKSRARAKRRDRRGHKH